jgi:GH25 family lysozyme M1 (1,4-beta-N-acetylmuramidase)
MKKAAFSRLKFAAFFTALALLAGLISGCSRDLSTHGSLADASVDAQGKILAYGVDVSVWQDAIDFQAVREAGADYVILRAGYRTSVDDRFEENYRNARAAGLDVGVYWYSYALSAEEAYDEALACLSVLDGKYFEYPVYFDYEDPAQSTLGAALSEQICLTFLDTVSNEGYYAGLYSGINWLDGYLPKNTLQEKYAYWMALYPNSGTYSDFASYCERYGMWQYSSTGRVDGISGNADMDVCFVDYPSLVRSSGLSGYAAHLSGSTLTLSGASCPTSLCFGSDAALSGTLSSSDGALRSVTVGVFDESGRLETGTTCSSDAQSLSLSELAPAVEFSSLPVGTHYFRITASNESEALTLLDVSLQVTPSTVSLSGATCPARVAEGNLFILRGTVTSDNGVLSRVLVQFLRDDGTVAAEKELTPGTATFDLKNQLSDSLNVASLSAGRYTYRITAQNDSGVCTLLSRDFTVVSRQAGADSGTYALTQTSGGVQALSAGSAAALTLDYLADGYYRLTDPQTGLVLTPENNGCCAGTQLAFAAYDALPGQQWQPLPAANGGYYLLNRSAQVYLAPSGADSGYSLGSEAVCFALSDPQSAPGSSPSGNDWTLVTDASMLHPGDRVVLTAADTDLVLSSAAAGTGKGCAPVIRVRSRVTPGAQAEVFVVCAGYGGTGIALRGEVTGQYLGNATGGESLREYTALTAASSWELTVAADGTSQLRCEASDGGILSYDRDSSCFCCYAAYRTPVALYVSAAQN